MIALRQTLPRAIDAVRSTLNSYNRLRNRDSMWQLYANEIRDSIGFYRVLLIRFHAFVAPLIISFYAAILSRPIREISRTEEQHGWLRQKMMVIALCALFCGYCITLRFSAKNASRKRVDIFYIIAIWRY